MSVDKLKESCIVVGAGIAGLCSAHVLQDSGMPVVVLDQGRAVGGRLATRVIKQGVFDYGAQFFTVCSINEKSTTPFLHNAFRLPLVNQVPKTRTFPQISEMVPKPTQESLF